MVSRCFKCDQVKKSLIKGHRVLLMALGLNTLRGNLASWVVTTDSLCDESLPDVVTLQQLHELLHAWAITRDSVHAALASLERARSAVVLPLCLTGRAAPPIWDEALDDEPCMPFVPFVVLHIPLICVRSAGLGCLSKKRSLSIYRSYTE